MSHNQNNSDFIELQDVSKTYKTGERDVTVLTEITLQIGSGEFVSIVGPSGAGKSTLLNILTGIDRPTTGKIYVGGQPLHKLSENQLARWRGRNIGVIFQFFQLLPTLTILENVMMPMDFCRVYRPRQRQRHAIALLEKVGIAGHAHKLPSALSGGEQQRAAIARALANNPSLIVADEPTGNLDSVTAAAIFDFFELLINQGKTVILVTHDLNLSARTWRQIHLLDGRIIHDEQQVSVDHLSSVASNLEVEERLELAAEETP